MKQRWTRLAARLLALGLGVALSIGLLESVLFVAYAVRDGEFVWAAERFRRDQDAFVTEQTSTREDCSYLEIFYPHPYLGFVHHANPPCGLPELRTNNVGLFGRDYPVLKNPDRFTILVTGGSVAAQFGSQIRTQPSKLERILNERYRPPSGSRFVVLNGGEGGWSQPQQSILFLLYSTLVDAVVTLDGYNEIQIMRRGHRLEYPGFLFHVVNPVASQGSRNLALAFIGRRASTFFRESPVLSRSYLGYFAEGRIRSAIKGRIEGAGAATQNTSLETIFSFPEGFPDDRRFPFNVEQYRRYIRSMRHLANGLGIQTAHFLQPVPALEKPLTEQERAVVGDLSYADDYRRLVDGLLELNDEGIPVASLVGVFSDAHGDIYEDKIHCLRESTGRNRVRSRGYTLMAEAMARELERVWRLERR